MSNSQLMDTVRKYQILIFLVAMLAVQSTAALLVNKGLLSGGWFEWSFVAKPGLALLMILLVDGHKGIMKVVRSMMKWKLHPVWYAVAFLGMPALLLVSVYVHRAFTGNLGVPVHFDPWALTGWHPRTWFSMTTMSVADEIAFFSFVYTRLAPRFTGLSASLITSVIWTLSYAPRMTMQSEMMADTSMPYWVLGANFVALAPICAWVYGSTKSAFLVVILQLAANFGTIAMPILPIHTGTNNVYLTQIGIVAIASTLIAFRFGPKYMTTTGLAPAPA